MGGGGGDGRAVSGWPCLGDMALLREDVQSKVRAAAPGPAEASCAAGGRAQPRAGPAGCEGAPRPLPAR